MPDTRKAHFTYPKSLLNMPVPFHPREPQLGSRVRFTPAYIHSA